MTIEEILDVQNLGISGDMILIEYKSSEPIERFSWGELIPSLSNYGVVVVDFYGIGEILLRKFIRKSGKEYALILDALRDIKVVKVGPGAVSYGELLTEVSPSYDPQIFLKHYYSIMTRISRLPKKPRYMIVFGLSHYIHFEPDSSMKALLTAVSSIPAEDLVKIVLVNKEILNEAQLSLLREVSTIVGVFEDGDLVF
ncbi:DUF257 family protein [Thermococcus sp.]